MAKGYGDRNPMLPAEVVRQIRRLQLRARRAVEDLLGGEYHSVFKGTGLSFEEVREYQPGDDVRSIDWNVTARMGSPFIKRFVEERELTVLLAVDVSGSQRFGTQKHTKRAVAAEVAALIAVSVSDPREASLPAAGLIEVEDAETGKHFLLDTRRASVRDAYAAGAAKRKAAFTALARSGKVDLIDVSTDGQHFDALVRFF